VSASDLARVLERLGERGQVGLVWADAAGVVTRVYGRLAADVPAGVALPLALPALAGQEAGLAALTDDDTLVIPNVAILTAATGYEPVRLDVSVHRDGDGFVAVLSRVLGAGVVDQLVEDETRKRRIADAELARINAQLEEFAYMISHDLMAPLRALRYYAGDVADAVGADPIDPEAVRAAAANIEMSTRRMSAMLKGLLDYARIGRRHEAVEAVDTSALIHDIVRALRPPAGLALDVDGTWPTLMTTAVPLDLILRNLIDNAIKHHDRQVGRVVVTGHPTVRGLDITVADDGPGIPPEWHEAIFEPFRRIEDGDSEGSSGIGLALVRRTIEAAGGRIAVASDPAKQRGTTFTVSWPEG
jgi:signal transduction histidine kinase